MIEPPSMVVRGKRLYTWYSQNLRLYIASLHAGVIGGEGDSEIRALEGLAELLESMSRELRQIAKLLSNRRIVQ